MRLPDVVREHFGCCDMSVCDVSRAILVLRKVCMDASATSNLVLVEYRPTLLMKSNGHGWMRMLIGLLIVFKNVSSLGYVVILHNFMHIGI